MNAAAVLVSAVLVSGAVGYAVATTAIPAPAESQPAGTLAANRVADLEARIADLQQQVQRLLDRAASAAVPAAREAATVSEAMIEQAVARWMEAHGDKAAASAESASARAGGLATQRDALARLEATKGDFDDMVKVWAEIEKAGLEDEVLAWLENQAKAAPGDAEAQYELGSALIVALQSKSPVQQGPLAMRADAAFDKALAADDHHWGARFSKATSLSFWPKITGKHLEAVRHFEVLMDQQEAQKTEPHFAQTYLFLGNMHQTSGKPEDARAVYERGLRYFPGNKQLEDQLAQLGK